MLSGEKGGIWAGGAEAGSRAEHLDKTSLGAQGHASHTRLLSKAPCTQELLP